MAMAMLGAVATTASAAVPSSGDEFVRGSVAGMAGGPLQGATVELLVWPSNDSVEAMKIGDSLPLTSLGITSTDASGAYQFVMSPGQRAASADAYGNLNTSVVVGAGRSRAWQAMGLGRERGGGPSGGGTEHKVPSMRVADAGAAASPPSADSAARGKTATRYAPAPGCSVVYVQDLGIRSALVGMHYSTTAGLTHGFVYEAGETSTVGVGVSSTGAYGSFSASGTHTRSSTTTVSFASATGNRHDYTYFAWGKYRTQCGGLITGYEARTRAYAGGGTSWDGPAAPAASYCVNLGGGVTTVTATANNRAYTAGGGADVSSAIGINLSTQTGYDLSGRVTYKNNTTGLKHLCGTSGYPGNAPGRLVGKA